MGIIQGITDYVLMRDIRESNILESELYHLTFEQRQYDSSPEFSRWLGYSQILAATYSFHVEDFVQGAIATTVASTLLLYSYMKTHSKKDITQMRIEMYQSKQELTDRTAALEKAIRKVEPDSPLN